MPAWLLTLLGPFIRMFLSFGANKLFKVILGNIKEYFEGMAARKAEHAKQEQAKQELKQDLAKAGDDEKAQEDAYSEFFKRTNK